VSSGRLLAARAAVAGVALAAALCASATIAAAQESTNADWSLPSSQDPPTRDQVVYSFKETFKYDLRPDSTMYGTAAHFRILFPAAYWATHIKNLTNEDGSLAWARSRDMMALVVMYDATGEPWYLDWLGRYAEAVMAARDDIAGKTDADGASNPGWGASRYGEGKRKVYLVHSGLILQPILEYVLRVGKSADGAAADSLRIGKLVERCVETLRWHDYQLDPKPAEGESVYMSGNEEIERRYLWQPYNRQGILARDFYLLYKITGEEEYRRRSEKLYAFFKNRLERTPSDAYIWDYEPTRGAGRVKVNACEDISHASFTMEGIVPACLDGFVFDRTDLARFARTFTRYVHWGDGVFQAGIGCRGIFNRVFLERLFAWLPLAQGDPEIYWLLHRFLLGNVANPSPQAVAFLVAHRPSAPGKIDMRLR